MIDNDMTNILKNFDGADSGAGTVTDAKTGEQKVSTAAAEKNAMKSLLEGLDAQQKSVNQMPGTHTMAKATAKHPAEKFLVGGEHDEESWMDQPGSGMLDADIASVIQDKFPDDDMLDIMAWEASAEEYGQPLTVEEYAKWRQYDDEGNLKEDEVDLSQYKDNYNKGYYTDDTGIEPGVQVHIGHFQPGASGVEGTVVKVDGEDVYIKNSEGQTYKGQLKNTTVQEATEDTYEDTIASRTQVSDVHEKQSLSDIFRSMDETEEDKAAQFKKELHDEIKASQLSKGANGKFNLAEEEELTWGDELLEDLKLLLDEAQRPQDVVDGVRSLIQQYEI